MKKFLLLTLINIILFAIFFIVNYFVCIYFKLDLIKSIYIIMLITWIVFDTISDYFYNKIKDKK